MRRILCFFVCVCLLLALTPLSAGAAAVVLSPQKLTVDGRPISCEKYNIDGSNYFRLRDIAYLLSGTASQFEVGYDEATRTVTVTSGLPYTPNGDELSVGEDKSATARPTNQTVLINGKSDAGLSAYNLGGYNFFKLRDLGAALGFTVDYDAATNTAVILSGGVSGLTASEVYRLCSPSVFYIETFDAEGYDCGAGSGFFIDGSGIAVTNHHVLRNAFSANAVLADGEVHKITGVLAFDPEVDYAIVKVEGSGFPALTLGDSASVSGGDPVYAIGSPKRLQNSISDGIVSNPSRAEYGGYIQITAPISSGSSGGALLNARGEVIGVTTAFLTSGQNLNFAVPIHKVVDARDLPAYRQGIGLYSLPEYAEVNAYLEYQALPAMFENVYYESENFELTNGDTLIGIVENDEIDRFFAYCNTPGRIEITLMSSAAAVYARDLVLTIRPFDPDAGDYAVSDFVIFDDGGEGQFASFTVSAPGCFVVHVYSLELYETGPLRTDYAFYYKFVPGAAAEEPPAERGGESGSRQALTFGVLKNWILTNWNDTVGDNADKGYFEWDTYSDGASGTLGAVYVDGGSYEAVILYNIYEYPDGSTDSAFISLNAYDWTSYVSYSFTPSSESSLPYFHGSLDLYAPDFSGSGDLVFENTTGRTTAAQLERLTYYARVSFCEALEFLEYLLLSEIRTDGSCSIRDFGFDPYALDVPEYGD
ncbi:MAG: trypsin-like peptidase domain-containing protein [Oscillospiraceae bacterium]|nr:trypsin-like peptidase domain-containing protein [Oscillospiraceae bacterium]